MTNNITLPVLYAVHKEDFLQYNSSQVAERFLIKYQHKPDTAQLQYTHYDRLITGVITPVHKKIALENYDNLKATYFLERRELGIINTGGEGIVYADGLPHQLQKLDCLYAGKRTQSLYMESKDPAHPAVFFLLSAPAHTTYPLTKMQAAAATSVRAGSAETANERTIYKYIHNDGIMSCQLVMGLTVLQPGSVWNTMPPHIHDRRSEVYFYFDVAPNHTVTHYMGYPGAYRNVQLNNYDIMVSPPWSIHAGKGTANYGFVWGMAGENKTFSDMDAVPFTP